MRIRPYLRCAGRLSLLPLVFFSLRAAHAGSATWKLNPISGDWSNNTNWTPETVPRLPGDVATLGLSNTTGVSLSSDQNYELGSIVFSPDGSAYTISLTFLPTLTISGAGMVNQSGVSQNFVLPVPGFRELIFTNEATAGTDTAYTIEGPGSGSGSDVTFERSSSAGEASFTNNGAISFLDQATAGSATFTNHASLTAGGSGAFCYFGYPGFTTGGGATFINEGATIAGNFGALTAFYSSGGLEHCTIINYGATVGGGFGGIAEIGNRTSAGKATLIAYGGTNGGDGGVIQFSGISSGGKAQVQVYGNGRIEIAYRSPTAPTVSIGSLSGDGLATLGQWQLDVGSDNRSTTFSGSIQDGGIQGGNGASLMKSGTGRFTLQSANTHTGGTFVNAGELMVLVTKGSPTGKGPVQVNGGRLTGKAFMAGAVTIGIGSGTGATLAPGRGPNPGILGSKKTLTFNADGSYACTLDSDAVSAAQAVGQGVTIDPAAQFSLTDVGASALPVGTTFTVISNTSANPISGTFSNLADGAIVDVNGNNLQASYSGGDGNDLTLTVVP